VRLSERSYSTKSVRPSPTVYSEPDGSLLIVTTSWGDPGLANKVNEDIAKYVQAATADVEVTSPFEFQTCLTDETNYLRIATLISNEAIYRSENRSEYSGGVETLVLYRSENKMAYVQVGAPHLLIQRQNLGLAPVAVSYETSLELGPFDQPLPPMPQQLIGIDSSLNIRCGDFRVEDSDRLILYCGSFWPEALWRASGSGDDLGQLTQKIVQKSPDAPFWIGLVSLDDY
jgi:hypothetical protein